MFQIGTLELNEPFSVNGLKYFYFSPYHVSTNNIIPATGL